MKNQHVDIDKELIKAVKSRDIKRVIELLERGANPNAKDEYGWTPLHHAAKKGSVDIAKLLINKGANVNAKSEEDSRVELARALFRIWLYSFARCCLRWQAARC